MKENKLVELSLDFSVDIINLVKFLKANHETIISNQIGRSGTSIGANIREAQYAHGKADFIAKLQIALKECNESEYWLELLANTQSLEPNKAEELLKDCRRFRFMLIRSINTAKQNSSLTCAQRESSSHD